MPSYEAMAGNPSSTVATSLEVRSSETAAQCRQRTFSNEDPKLPNARGLVLRQSLGSYFGRRIDELEGALRRDGTKGHSTLIFSVDLGFLGTASRQRSAWEQFSTSRFALAQDKTPIYLFSIWQCVLTSFLNTLEYCSSGNWAVLNSSWFDNLLWGWSCEFEPQKLEREVCAYEFKNENDQQRS